MPESSERQTPRQRTRRWVTWVLTAFVMVGCAAFLTAKFNRFRNANAMSVVRALDHGSPRPYAARVLVPVVSNGVAAALPEAVDQALAGLARAAVPELVELHRVPDRLLASWSVMLLLHLGAFLGLCVVARSLLIELYGAHRAVATAGAVALALSVQLLWVQGARFLYDPPTIFFGALLTLAIVRRQPWWFLAGLVVASLNKETAAVFVLMYGLCGWSQEPRGRLLRMLGIQVAAVMAVRLAVIGIADLGGPTDRHDNFMRDYWDFNRYWFAHARFWVRFPEMVALVAAGVVLLRKWSEHPAVVRSSWAGAALLFLGLMRGGVWGELRVFGDVFAPLGLAAVVNVVGLARGESGAPSLKGIEVERPAVEWAIYVGMNLLVWMLVAGSLAAKLDHP